jgi:enoyl-CoA hydratase/carnithine racemase
LTSQVQLELSVRGNVAVVTLNRPPVNALSRALLGQLKDTLKESAGRPEARVIVLASALPKAFSAGADIQELVWLDEAQSADFTALGHSVCNYIEALPKPVIAAVRGIAFGGGCEVAMACDLRIAGASASFALPEINLGIIPGWGGTQRLPRLVGKTAALEMMMTGTPVPAAQALSIGLVNRVVADEEVLNEAVSLGELRAAKPPIALALAKRAVHEGAEVFPQDALVAEQGLFAQVRNTQDAQEGIEAFLEKRKPRYQGR